MRKERIQTYRKTERNDMKMIRIAMVLAAVLLVSACSAPADTADAAAADTAEAAAASEDPEPEAAPGSQQQSGAEDTSPEGSTSPGAQKAEETVTIVIPTVYESVATQEEADEIRDKNGYESAVLEEDGSLTIVMTRSRHERMVEQFKKSVDDAIAEITGPEGVSSISKIEYNDDYSVFTVTVSSDELGMAERQTADELVLYGTLYHIYTGNSADHIQVDYVNSETGEIMESADSGDLSNAY